jgi:hypothetical protein
VLQQQNSSSDSADSKAGGSSSSSTYTLMQNPGIFASNFIPLWAGVAQGGLVQGGRVVEALQNSGLVQPAGVCLLGRGGQHLTRGGGDQDELLQGSLVGEALQNTFLVQPACAYPTGGGGGIAFGTCHVSEENRLAASNVRHHWLEATAGGC